MGKNDYRRSLIMLRGLEKGYSGHARLERRVLSGTMDFVAAVPAAEETFRQRLWERAAEKHRRKPWAY